MNKIEIEITKDIEDFILWYCKMTDNSPQFVYEMIFLNGLESFCQKVLKIVKPIIDKKNNECR